MAQLLARSIYHALLIVILCQPIRCILCDKETDNVETSLKQQLFCNGYDPKKRPALDEFDTLNISSFSVLYQFEFSDYSDTMDGEMIQEMFWTDSRLTWNASDWSNITNIQITHDEVWFPHFENILSDYKGVSSLSCTNPNCNLYHTGSVYCLPVCTISAMCSPAYSRWPFNTVSCHMWFSNRDKELVDEINFLPMRTQMGLNASPGAWCLTSFEANTTTLEYPGAAVRTVEKFTFGLHHNPNTAIVGVYGPLLGLVFFNIIISWLHSLANERSKLALISFVCHYLFIEDSFVNLEEASGPSSFLIVSMTLAFVLFIVSLVIRGLHSQHILPVVIDSKWMQPTLNNKVSQFILEADYLSIGSKTFVFAYPDQNKEQNWSKIVKLFDRVVFLVYISVYLVLFFICIPLQHDKPAQNMLFCSS